MAVKYDYCIVGAGLSGMVMAERLTAAGKSVVIVEKRGHIGGNCHDEPDVNGVLYHVYGPHYFRTNLPHVRDFLSRFTDWQLAEYRIKAYAKDRLWSFPVNLVTFEQLLGRPSTSEEFGQWLEERRVKIDTPANSEEVVLSQVGREFYELFFEGYTLKQWKRHPRELSPSVCGRIPMRLNRDERYFSDSFQAMPRQGYAAMFNRMLESCGKRATLFLNTDFTAVRNELSFDRLIYTGPVDAYFDHRFGPLPWRSLHFEPHSLRSEELADRREQAGKSGFWQSAVQVNYPNEHEYTRTVEVKHVTGQQTPHTNVVYEYPRDFEPGAEPYYPIPSEDSAKVYARYAELAAKERSVLFLGRLATYKYLNMDQVVDTALREAERLIGGVTTY